jgi:hypothetical protein
MVLASATVCPSIQINGVRARVRAKIEEKK